MYMYMDIYKLNEKEWNGDTTSKNKLFFGKVVLSEFLILVKHAERPYCILNEN